MSVMTGGASGNAATPPAQPTAVLSKSAGNGMLDVNIYAHFLNALHSAAAHFTGKEAVLRVIFVVTAIERAAVHVGSRCIQAGITVLQCLFAVGVANFNNKRGVPDLGNGCRVREANGLACRAAPAANLCRAICIGSLNLADAFHT